jgi:hypothetical protein
MIREKHDLLPAENEAHQETYGGFNSYPPGWTEINAAGFAKSDYFGWTPVLIEFRQMFPKSPEMSVLMGPAAVSAHLHFMPSGQGYAIVNDYWGGTIRYFQFGTRRQDWLKGVDSSD